jgi:sterol 24-C-methyltransferase
MYIPPTLDPSLSIFENQILIERKFAEWLGMKANDKVFELGCGRGRVAAHLASITGAHITGINIDQGQLDDATSFAKQNGLSEQCRFMNADFNDLPFPFPDNYFDCIYEVQALSLSRDLEKLFQELNRILKPGGKLSLFSEWVCLPKYDPQNPHHAELLKQIKPLVGAIGTPTPAEYEAKLRSTGFDVLMSFDPSVNKSQELFIGKAGNPYDKLIPIIKFLTKIKIFPAYFNLLFERLGRHSDALCEADRLGLINMSYQFIAQKQS